MGCNCSFYSEEKSSQTSSFSLKSQLFIKDVLKVSTNSPGGSEMVVKATRRKMVPRLQDISRSSLISKRSQNIGSASTISDSL